jgi:hypothetical protein
MFVIGPLWFVLMVLPRESSRNLSTVTKPGSAKIIVGIPGSPKKS